MDIVIYVCVAVRHCWQCDRNRSRRPSLCGQAMVQHGLLAYRKWRIPASGRIV